MSSINSNYGNYSNAPVNQTKSYKKVDDTEKKTSEASAEQAKASEKRTDTFEKGSASVKGNTYTKGVKTEYTGKSALEIKNSGMKDMVAQMINGQASHAAGKSDTGLTLESIMKSYGLDYIESDGSEDFWGADKTAERILDFAKNLAGNDPKNFEKIKNAFEKGFGECEGVWGGKLPDVCYDTLDRVRQGFDDWENELNAQADAVSTSASAQ